MRVTCQEFHREIHGKGTWLLGLRWRSRVHFSVPAKSVQVALDCFQSVIPTLLPCLSTPQQESYKDNLGWKTVNQNWREERFTLGLTLLSSLSFCFCSSNCLLFLSSSIIFCWCSRRFLKTIEANTNLLGTLPYVKYVRRYRETRDLKEGLLFCNRSACLGFKGSMLFNNKKILIK